MRIFPCLFLVLAFLSEVNGSKDLNKNITCNSVISYFGGTFQSKSDPSVKQQVQFQLRLTRFEKQRIHLLVDHWNETLGSINHIILRPFHDGTNQGYAQLFELTRGNLINTSGPVDISLYRQRTDAYWTIYWAHTYDNQFHLYSTDGHCTNAPFPIPENDEKLQTKRPDPSLYRFCSCCGKVYNPDALINCPENPYVEFDAER